MSQLSPFLSDRTDAPPFRRRQTVEADVQPLIRAGLIVGILAALLVGWVGAAVWAPVNFRGVVLLACIAGFGYGLRPGAVRRFDLLHLLLPVVGLTGLLAVPAVRDWLAEPTEEFARLLIGVVLLVLVGTAFAPVGRLVAAALRDRKPMGWAVGVTAAAAITGAAAVTILLVVGLPPAAGLALFAAAVVGFAGDGRRSRLVDVGVLAVCVMTAGLT